MRILAMATAREELHALIDRLSEEDAERWLLEIQQSLPEESKAMLEWLNQAEKLQNKLLSRYGEITDSVSMLDEVREERLNDLMGRQ
jgi:Rad3-related DNA helicase